MFKKNYFKDDPFRYSDQQQLDEILLRSIIPALSDLLSRTSIRNYITTVFLRSFFLSLSLELNRYSSARLSLFTETAKKATWKCKILYLFFARDLFLVSNRNTEKSFYFSYFESHKCIYIKVSGIELIITGILLCN